MMELIDLKQARIVSIKANETFTMLSGCNTIPIGSISIGIEVNGFRKTFYLKGEKVQYVLDYIKDAILRTTFKGFTTRQ